MGENMKSKIDRMLGTVVLMLISISFTHAANRLAVTKSESNALEIQLVNSEEVGGVQFSVCASSDLVLNGLERGLRTEDSHWMVASYRLNDSTINVLVMSAERKSLNSGQGALARIPFTSIGNSPISRVSLANVMVAGPNADSLAVITDGIQWSNRPAISANDGQSNAFALCQNFPNPFNPSTKITYRLNKDAQVRLSVYDMTGREVNRLIDQYQPIGNYNVEWNSSKENGQKLSSGIYFAHLTVDNESASKKMILTK
jgi:hypothetical protein